jgi:hypothetical protein
MGWKAIKTLNKQEHLDREAAVTAPEETTTAKNAVRELPPPLSETHEVITGPGGWIVVVPFETTEEPAEATILPEGAMVSVTEEVSTKSTKKPSSDKKKKVSESA